MKGTMNASQDGDSVCDPLKSLIEMSGKRLCLGRVMFRLKGDGFNLMVFYIQ